MNTRVILLGLIAGTCLAASVAMAGSRGSASTTSTAHISAGAMSAPHISGGTMSAPRISGGAASVPRISTASANMPRTFSGATSRPRIGTGTSGTGLATTNHWSGNNSNCHHHHHHRSVVFIDTFGFPYWYDYYPYSYYDYDPVVYTNDGSLVAEVQQRLARAGYYHGSIDGVLGPRTQAAIRAYERARGLRVDGMISNSLTATMGLR